MTVALRSFSNNLLLSEQLRILILKHLFFSDIISAYEQNNFFHWRTNNAYDDLAVCGNVVVFVKIYFIKNSSFLKMESFFLAIFLKKNHNIAR